MSSATLEELAEYDTDEVFELAPPITIEDALDDTPSPAVFKNLAKLKKLGICTMDAVMALVGQAPIDPVNLMGTLMQANPEGWAFSAIDFSMVRVLSRTAKKTVAAALRVDLMSNVIATLVLNKANQLTIYKTLEVEPREGMMEQIQALCDEAVVAAKREALGRNQGD